MKIKLFSHTDLDGVGCAILAKSVLGPENVNVTYCEYKDVNEKVTSFLDHPDGLYDRILITDISVNEEIAARIEAEGDGKFTLLDHHQTALWLNEYDWATVETHLSANHKHSGTSLLKAYLKKLGYDTSNQAHFVEQVRQYDTWEWDTFFYDINPKKLNDLLSILGKGRFTNSMLIQLGEYGTPLISEENDLVLELRQQEIDRYIRSKEKKMMVGNFEDYTAGIIIAERFASEMGNTLAKQYPELDLIAIINLDYESVSLRTIHDFVDLSELAKRHGGGGHPKASGMPLNEAARRLVVELQFPSARAYEQSHKMD